MPVRVNNELAEWVASVKGNRSSRQVEIKTGVSYATVAAMLNGRTPSAETIIRFARAFAEDVPAALRLAGYDDIAEMWETGAAPTQVAESPFRYGELTREPVFDNPRLHRIHEFNGVALDRIHHLPPDEYERYVKILEAQQEQLRAMLGIKEDEG